MYVCMYGSRIDVWELTVKLSSWKEEVIYQNYIYYKETFCVKTKTLYTQYYKNICIFIKCICIYISIYIKCNNYKKNVIKFI